MTGFSSGRDPLDSSHCPDIRLSGAAEETLRHPCDQLNFDLLTFALWPPLEAKTGTPGLTELDLLGKADWTLILISSG